MHPATGRQIVGAVLGLVVSMALGQVTPVVAEPIAWQRVPPFAVVPGSPPLVRFTGTLLSPEEADTGIDTLSVSVEGKEWIFKVNRVRELTGPAHGQMILEDIFPPRLRFVGPDEFIVPLQQPGITEQVINVEGRLYIAHRMFLVTAVETFPLEEQES